MVEKTAQTDRAELSSSEEKGLLDRTKRLLSPFKSDRWLSVAVYASLTTIGLAIGTLVWNWADLQTNPSEQSKRKFDASLSVVSTGATLAAGIVLFLNFRVANRNAEIAQKKLDEDLKKAERDEKLAQSRLTVERFNKAVEMLGKNDSIHLRLGGIYALESIAADSNKDAPDENYRQVLEVLTAFVRENAPYPPKAQATQAETQATLAEQSPEEQPTGADENTKEEISPLPTDIQAVLTFLKRRRHKDKDWAQYPFDLRKADLGRANLGGTNLQKADLTEANLQEADLDGANLQEAFLAGANLQEAFLAGANLQEAVLAGANLQRTSLVEANLQQAGLAGANLQKAFLVEANLQETFLVEANLQEAVLSGANLRGAQFWSFWLPETALAEAKENAKANLQSALFWETAQYDPEIREWLGLPPETLEVD